MLQSCGFKICKLSHASMYCPLLQIRRSKFTKLKTLDNSKICMRLRFRSPKLAMHRNGNHWNENYMTLVFCQQKINTTASLQAPGFPSGNANCLLIYVNESVKLRVVHLINSTSSFHWEFKKCQVPLFQGQVRQ